MKLVAAICFFLAGTYVYAYTINCQIGVKTSQLSAPKVIGELDFDSVMKNGPAGRVPVFSGLDVLCDYSGPPSELLRCGFAAQPGWKVLNWSTVSGITSKTNLELIDYDHAKHGGLESAQVNCSVN